MSVDTKTKKTATARMEPESFAIQLLLIPRVNLFSIFIFGKLHGCGDKFVNYNQKTSLFTHLTLFRWVEIQWAHLDLLFLSLIVFVLIFFLKISWKVVVVALLVGLGFAVVGK